MSNLAANACWGMPESYMRWFEICLLAASSACCTWVRSTSYKRTRVSVVATQLNNTESKSTPIFTQFPCHKEMYSITPHNPEVQHYFWFYFYKPRLLRGKALHLHTGVHYAVLHQNTGALSVHSDEISETWAKSLSEGDTQRLLPSCLCHLADSSTWDVSNIFNHFLQLSVIEVLQPTRQSILVLCYPYVYDISWLLT